MIICFQHIFGQILFYLCIEWCKFNYKIVNQTYLTYSTMEDLCDATLPGQYLHLMVRFQRDMTQLVNASKMYMVITFCHIESILRSSFYTIDEEAGAPLFHSNGPFYVPSIPQILCGRRIISTILLGL